MIVRRLPTLYALRNISRSPVRSALSITGTALVALLVLAAAAFAIGMGRTLEASGSPRNVLLLGAGSEESIERSEIGTDVPTLAAADIDGVAVLFGTPLVSPEIHLPLPIGPSDGATTTLVLRGVEPIAYLVHGRVRLVEGRAAERGADELVLGRSAQASLRRAGLPHELGEAILLDGVAHRIVGIQTAPGTVVDGEAWMPREGLRILARRTTDSCAVVTLAPEGDPADVELFAATRIDLELSALGETDYYAALSQFLAPIRWLVLATAGLMAIGGLLGGLSLLDAVFAARIREFGALQSIGFGRPAIVVSMLEESLFASLVGGLVAIAAGMLLLDGLAVRSSMGTFALRVDHLAVLAALGSSILLGVVGALVPAIRCLRLPIGEALKASL